MSSKANDDSISVIAFIVVAVGVAAVWKFSQVFGLPWEISAKVIGYTVLSIVVMGVWTYFSRMSFNPVPVWPLFLAALYSSWFPAFDHWGVSTTAYMTLSYIEDTRTHTEVAWYALWYVKLLINCTLVFGGYTLDRKWKEL
ncbi:TPA: hypothetical protein NJ874_004607 [Vibrio parahaemolyticus]|nr:hypothetical protein [Vibrio parahaemolyticus]